MASEPDWYANTAQMNPNEKNPNHARLLRLASQASMAVALTLIVAKSIAYQHSPAVSLLASLLDSVIDSAASLATFIAVRYALVPADDQHRFGHGKAEALAALLQSILLVFASFMLLREALLRLWNPEAAPSLAWGIGVMGLSLLLTTALLALQRYVISRTHSVAIEADSLHYKADLLSNAAIIVALILAQRGFYLADPIMACLIAVYLLSSTRQILRRALDELLDRELPSEQREAILTTAMQCTDVRGVHDLRTRMSGPTAIIQMHLELDGTLSLIDAHAIADSVEQAILDRYPEADVVIHQDPIGVRERRRWTQ